jgi:hypothetical protein
MTGVAIIVAPASFARAARHCVTDRVRHPVGSRTKQLTAHAGSVYALVGKMYHLQHATLELVPVSRGDCRIASWGAAASVSDSKTTPLHQRAADRQWPQQVREALERTDAGLANMGICTKLLTR